LCRRPRESEKERERKGFRPAKESRSLASAVPRAGEREGSPRPGKGGEKGGGLPIFFNQQKGARNASYGPPLPASKKRVAGGAVCHMERGKKKKKKKKKKKPEAPLKIDTLTAGPRRYQRGRGSGGEEKKKKRGVD